MLSSLHLHHQTYSELGDVSAACYFSTPFSFFPVSLVERKIHFSVFISSSYSPFISSLHFFPFSSLLIFRRQRCLVYFFHSPFMHFFSSSLSFPSLRRQMVIMKHNIVSLGVSISVYSLLPPQLFCSFLSSALLFTAYIEAENEDQRHLYHLFFFRLLSSFPCSSCLFLN